MGLHCDTVNIATGETASAAARLHGRSVVKIELPAELTSTAMTFTESEDGSTFLAVNTDSGARSITVAASKVVHLDPLIHGCEWLKVVAGSAETREGGTNIKIYTSDIIS